MLKLDHRLSLRKKIRLIAQRLILSRTRFLSLPQGKVLLLEHPSRLIRKNILTTTRSANIFNRLNFALEPDNDFRINRFFIIYKIVIQRII